MTRTDQARRLAVKTPEGAYLQVLEKGFGFAPRVAQAILATAQEALGGVSAEEVRPGQIRMVVASLEAPFGPPLEEIDKIEVTLTIDAGAEDEQVRQEQGLAAQRRGRIFRILDEALEQGGVLTQEDLGRALGVTSRTIRRDVKALKEAGHLVHTRGQLKGVGRGQTHKVKIIELWLDREGYDKISRWVHHSPQAIQRYVSTFAVHASGKAYGLAAQRGRQRARNRIFDQNLAANGAGLPGVVCQTKPTTGPNDEIGGRTGSDQGHRSA